MPKLMQVASHHRAIALGNVPQEKSWIVLPAFVATLSILVLAACTPAEPTPVDVAPIETSQTEEPSYEWVRGMPDPRPAFKTTDQGGSTPREADSSDNEYTDNEIWCVPGCLLASSPDGSPVVPEWCTAWSASGSSYFAQESVDGDLAPDSSIVQFEVQQRGRDLPKMMCTRINLDRLTSSATAGASGALRSINLGPMKVSRFNGDVVGMNCLPGCVTSWNMYGYRGETIEMQKQRENAMRLPEWCAMGTDGCRESGAESIRQCGTDYTKMSVCTRLKFTDPSEEFPNVE